MELWIVVFLLWTTVALFYFLLLWALLKECLLCGFYLLFCRILNTIPFCGGLQCNETIWSDITGHRRIAGEISTCITLKYLLNKVGLKQKKIFSLHYARRDTGVVQHFLSNSMKKRSPSLHSTEERKTFATLLKIFMKGNKKTNSSGCTSPVT